MTSNRIILSDFQNLPERYIRVWNCNTSINNFFLSKIWFDIFCEAVVSDKQKALCICLELQDKRPALIFPIWIDLSTHFLSTRKIRSLSNYYTGLFSPIYLLESHEFDKKQALADIANYIYGHLRWDILDILPLENNSTSFNYLLDAFSTFNTNATPYFAHANWYQSVNNMCYSKYLSCRPSSLRNTIKRKIRKVQKDYELTLTTQNDYSLEYATQIFNEVYFKRWKKIEPFPEFISTLFSKLNDLGLLRLGILEFNNKPVAVQAWIVFNKTASIYKLAHLPEYALYSPGTIITSMMFENVITIDKVSTIDFLTGDENYKSLWMDNRKELWGIQVANTNTFLGKIAAFRNRISTILQTE